MTTKSKQRVEEPQPIHPNHIYRKKEGLKLFGYRHSQLEEAIKQGKLPPLLILTEGGRNRGWLGQRILDHQAALLAKAKAGGK